MRRRSTAEQIPSPTNEADPEVRRRPRAETEIVANDRDGIDEREAWLNAFEAQLTTTMIRSVEVHARSLVRWATSEGAVVGELAARELVQDAISDVFEGTVRWDVSEPLDLRLKDIVRWRARDLLTGFASVRFANCSDIGEELERGSLGELGTDALTFDPSGAEEPSLSEGRAQRLALLQRLAGQDHEVAAMIRAIGRGIVKRRDLKQALGLSDVDYHRVRARFERVAAAVRALGDNLEE